jgi:hypothetical protein
MGLHDYYQDRYAVALAKSKAKKPVAEGITLTLTLTIPVVTSDEAAIISPIDRPTSPDEEPPIPVTPDEVILADKEFLQYLTMPYTTRVAEAFDDDSSGFIRISEVNEFTSGRPEGWTLLQWRAYIPIVTHREM